MSRSNKKEIQVRFQWAALICSDTKHNIQNTIKCLSVSFILIFKYIWYLLVPLHTLHVLPVAPSTKQPFLQASVLHRHRGPVNTVGDWLLAGMA